MLPLAVIFAFVANIIRAYRWSLFIKPYEMPLKRNLFRALGIGNAVNFFVPFKLGEFFRAWIAGNSLKCGHGFSLATVIVERLLDLIFIGAVFGFFSAFNISQAKNEVFFYAVFTASILAVIVICYICRGILKKAARAFSSIFNQKIEIKILKFCWSLIWSFKDLGTKINKAKLLLSTLLMWSLYFVSYIFFSKMNFSVVFERLFNFKTVSVGNFWDNMNAESCAYTLVPALLLIVASFIVRQKTVGGENEFVNLFPHINESERLAFLEMYFSDTQREYISTYFKINNSVVILRDCSAGSNATTILCADGKSTFWRKYSFGNDAEKLYEQVEWIRSNSDKIPLPEILQCVKEDKFCFYDMPYFANAVGLFEYAHSLPFKNAWSVIENSICCLEENLYQKTPQSEDIELTKKYIRQKVEKNLEKITAAKYLRDLQKYDTIFVNGKPCKNLRCFLPYLTEEHLMQVFSADGFATIHGDLTIENIVCKKDSAGDGFYIIDPNTGNIHNSPNLDYAKLLQSIHGNYEFLMATKKVEFAENRISFTFIKSDAYKFLFNKFDSFMTKTFSAARVKSIYFHEVIHWLRLLPYKIEKNGERVLLFYAGLLLVLNDVVARFEEAK